MKSDIASSALGAYDFVMGVSDMSEEDVRDVLSLILERLKVKVVCNETPDYKSFRLVEAL